MPRMFLQPGRPVPDPRVAGRGLPPLSDVVLGSSAEQDYLMPGCVIRHEGVVAGSRARRWMPLYPTPSIPCPGLVEHLGAAAAKHHHRPVTFVVGDAGSGSAWGRHWRIGGDDIWTQ